MEYESSHLKLIGTPQECQHAWRRYCSSFPMRARLAEMLVRARGALWVATFELTEAIRATCPWMGICEFDFRGIPGVADCEYLSLLRWAVGDVAIERDDVNGHLWGDPDPADAPVVLGDWILRLDPARSLPPPSIQALRVAKVVWRSSPDVDAESTTQRLVAWNDFAERFPERALVCRVAATVFHNLRAAGNSLNDAIEHWFVDVDGPHFTSKKGMPDFAGVIEEAIGASSIDVFSTIFDIEKQGVIPLVIGELLLKACEGGRKLRRRISLRGEFPLEECA